MLNLIAVAESTLFVRDAKDDYSPAPAEVIRVAARQMIDTKMQRGRCSTTS